MNHCPAIHPREILFEKIEILLIEHFQFHLTLARDQHVMIDDVQGVLQRSREPFDGHVRLTDLRAR